MDIALLSLLLTLNKYFHTGSAKNIVEPSERHHQPYMFKAVPRAFGINFFSVKNDDMSLPFCSDALLFTWTMIL